MELTKEKFNSLKQLDRIEYRQKQDRILEVFSDQTNLTLYLSWSYILFLLSSCVFTSSLFGYKAAQIVCIKIINVSPIALLIIFIGLCFDIGRIILKNKVLNKLNEEYFKVEVKDARRKK